MLQEGTKCVTGNFQVQAETPVVSQIVMCDVQPDTSIVEFVRITLFYPAAGTTTVYDRTLDLTAPYVVTGTASTCDETGDPAVWKQGMVRLCGGAIETWSPTALMTSYSVDVKTVADPLNPPTFVDSFGNLIQLEAGDAFNFCDANDIIDTSAIVTSNPGDCVIITYVSY